MLTSILAAAQLLAQQASACVAPSTDLAARCGTVRVYENRAAGKGRTLDVRYVLVPAIDANFNGRNAVPIVPVPGGPGQNLIANAGGWLSVIIGDARRTHPVLFVDPRGSGNPGALECDFSDAHGKLAGYFREFAPMRRVIACRDSLSTLYDLRQYTTENIAADLDDVRKALGFDQIITYGVSGGTRQSLFYLKRYPAHVKGLILAAVVPHDFRLPMHYARDTQAAFDSLAKDCDADSACVRAFPRFRSELRDVLVRLQRAPAHVALPNPNGADTAIITRDIFAEQIRTRFYRPELAARVPLMVHRAHEGDFLPFATSIVPGWRPPALDNIPMPLYLAITCAEDVSRIDSVEAERLAAGTFLGPYRVRQQLRACHAMPKPTLPPDHFTPARSNVPVLAFSGDADPVTPPMWAASALQNLPNSRHVVFPHGSHSALGTACAASIVKQFVESLAPRTLDVSCARESRRPPFVLR